MSTSRHCQSFLFFKKKGKNFLSLLYPDETGKFLLLSIEIKSAFRDENQLFLIFHPPSLSVSIFYPRLAIIPQHMDEAKLISFFFVLCWLFFRAMIKRLSTESHPNSTRKKGDMNVVFLHHRMLNEGERKIIKNAIKCKVIE